MGYVLGVVVREWCGESCSVSCESCGGLVLWNRGGSCCMVSENLVSLWWKFWCIYGDAWCEL